MNNKIADCRSLPTERAYEARAACIITITTSIETFELESFVLRSYRVKIMLFD